MDKTLSEVRDLLTKQNQLLEDILHSSWVIGQLLLADLRQRGIDPRDFLEGDGDGSSEDD